MFLYKISNLKLKSYIEFPELIKIKTKSIDLELKEKPITLGEQKPFHNILNKNNRPWIKIYKDGNSYILYFLNLAKFKIINKKIYYQKSNKQISDTIVRHLFLNQVIPYYLSLENLVLHCSAVSYKNKAYLFVGKSGQGKSTIASLLLNHAKLVSDDFVLIKKHKSNYYSIGSYPVIRLANIVNANSNIVDSRNNYTNLKKNVFSLSNKCLFENKELKIKKIYFLNRLIKNKWKSISIKSKDLSYYFKYSLENIFVLNPSCKKTKVKLTHSLIDLISQTECQYLEFGDLAKSKTSDLAKKLL